MRNVIDVNFQVKTLNEAGEFEGYGAVFGNLDSYRDTIAQGAFANTLKEHQAKGRLPAMLWQHDFSEPIGVWREMKEDSRGLFVKGELFVDEIPRARQAHKLIKENGMSGLSIGFRTIDSEIDPKTGVRELIELDLMEVSVVTFPANDEARIQAVKTSIMNGETPTEREFEAFLRDAGFSRKEAKGIIAQGYSAIVSLRDAGEEDEQREIVEALKGLTESMRG